MGHKFQPTQGTGFQQCYVIFSNSKGVYLGDGRWSLVNPGDKNRAPVYTHSEAMDVLEAVITNGATEATIKECWPDQANGKTASKNMCAAAGLPSW